MSSSITVVGIDPGLDGGIAILTDGKLREVRVIPTKPGPKGGRDIDAAVLDVILCCYLPITRVALEIVHAMRGQGVTSMFNFGKGYGKILGVLEVRGLSTTHVTPQKWKKAILDGLGKNKNDSIRFAMSLYPKQSFKPTERCKNEHDGMAEAVCLAEYARREVLGFVNKGSDK